MGAAGVHGYWNQHPYCGRPGGAAIEVRGEINVVFKGDPRSLLVLPGQGGDGAPGRGGRGKAGAADDPFNRQLAHPRMDHHPDIAGYVPGGGIPNAWWRLFDGGRDVVPYGGGGHGGSGGGGGGTIDQIAERSIDPATYGQFGTIGGVGGGDDDLGRRGWDGKRAEYPVFHDPYFVGDQVARRRATPGGDGGRGRAIKARDRLLNFLGREISSPEELPSPAEFGRPKIVYFDGGPGPEGTSASATATGGGGEGSPACEAGLPELIARRKRVFGGVVSSSKSSHPEAVSDD